MGNNKTQKELYNEELVELTEKDFYPPADNRTLHMYHGEDFQRYAEYIYNLYEDEGFYEN